MEYKGLTLTPAEAESASAQIANAAAHLTRALEDTLFAIEVREKVGRSPAILYSRERSLITAIGVINDAKTAWDSKREKEGGR